MVHEWYTWGESAAKAGFTGMTSDAGYPDVYTYTGDTVTLRNLPNPIYIAGFAMGVTKTGGARIKGNLSYGAQYTYLPSLGDNSRIADAVNFPPKVFQREEIITGEGDSANTNEVTMAAALFAYGQAHRYPTSWPEVLSMLPGNPRRIHTPQFSVTSAGALAAGSGAATMESASQEDLWINKDSTYYVLGVIPHLVDNNGLLQMSGNLPYNEYAANYIPITMGAPTVDFRGTVPCFPYEPIGPFNMASQPRIGLYSTAAAATTFSCVMAEM